MSAVAKPGWTSVAISTNNIALFYNRTTGATASAKVEADGTLIPQRYTGDKGGLGPVSGALDKVIAGPNGTVLFYHYISGDTLVYQVSDTGVLNLVKQQPIAQHWSTISIDPRSGWASLYNPTDGLFSYKRVNADGSITNIKTDSADKTCFFDQFVPLGQDVWIWYAACSGRIYTYVLRADGSTSAKGAGSNITTGWTNVVYAGDTQSGDASKIYFYNKNTGTTEIWLVDHATGKREQTQVLSNGLTGWSHWASALNGVVLHYDTTTGKISTDIVNDVGSISGGQQYTYKP